MNLLARLSLVSLVLILVLQQCQLQTRSDKIISVDEVYSIINDSVRVNEYVLLDTRARMDYIRGHLVSAFWLSPDSIESKIGIMLSESRPFIIYDSGEASAGSKVSRILSEKGLANFFVMDGGFSEWVKRGHPVAIQLVRNTSDKIDIQRKDISTTEAYEKLRSPGSEYVFIDIRSILSFEEGHIKYALSVPYVPINEFVVRIEEEDFARDTPVIIYCDANADVGEKAAEVMLRNDFSQVYILRGGIEEWASKKYPMEYGPIVPVN